MAEQPQAETIFGKVIQIGAVGERNAFLDGACHGDPALRQEVDKLVHDYFRAGEFLEQPVAQIAAPTLDQPITEKPGTQIGPYKLLQQIGEGGMGVVYMAEQKQPLKRRVALKIIKPGMDTRQVIARFEAERQALAMMDHPNIAKVLDAGQTDSGRPYFVMELVNGISVTKYCDQQHLTPKERLQLFVNICQAVQHAHQKGIIHRDLKPSNVLVSLYDGKAVPKVIDFGVAKATNQSLTDKTMFTQLGQIVGTLEYMSPEQAQRNQLDVDTRSDIYSLGVILYELLSGETPFDSKKLRSAALEEMLRIIREDEPSKPSTKVSSSQSLPSIAANRRIAPQKLGATIRGELDWIVMKALEKDRSRRYETASKFAEDVENYLNDEAVIACPPTTAYRFRKFARRNKAAIGTAAVISVAVIAGGIGTSWQAYRATEAEGVAEERLEIVESQKTQIEEEKQKAVAEAERANKEAENAINALAVAQAGYDFLSKDVLGMAYSGKQVEAGFSADPDIKLRTVLDRAAVTLGDRFHDQPVAEAAIHFQLGDTYLALGNALQSEEHFRRALELQQEHLGSDHHNTHVSMAGRANALAKLNRTEEAEALIREALTLHQRSFGLEVPEAGQIGNRLKILIAQASILRDLRNLERSAEVCREALELCSKTQRSQSRLAAQIHVVAGGTFRLCEKFSEAERHYRQALEICEHQFEPTHPDSSKCMGMLGIVLRKQGKNQEALAFLEKAYELKSQAFAPGHISVQKTAIALGNTLQKLNRNSDAESIMRDAFESVISQPNQGQLYSAELFADLVFFLDHDGRPREATQILDDFLKWAGGPRHDHDADFASVMLGAAYHFGEHGNNNERAYECSQLAYDIFQLSEGAGGPRTNLARQLLAACSSRFSFDLANASEPKGQDSEEILRLAELGREMAVGTDNFGPSHLFLGVAYYRNRRYQKAIDAFEKAKQLSGEDDGNFGFFRAMAHWQAGNHDRALSEYERTVAWMESDSRPKEQVLFRDEAKSVIPEEVIDDFRKRRRKNSIDNEEERTVKNSTKK